MDTAREDEGRVGGGTVYSGREEEEVDRNREDEEDEEERRSERALAPLQNIKQHFDFAAWTGKGWNNEKSIQHPSTSTTIQETEDDQNRKPETWVRLFTQNKTPYLVCLFGESCSFETVNLDELRDHLKKHAEIEMSASGPMQFVPCQVSQCDRVFMHGKKDAMFSHMAMHAFHASIQRKGLQALVDRGLDSSIEDCGFETKLKITHEGDAIYCRWDECERGFLDLHEFFIHVLQHVEFAPVTKKNAVCQWEDCGKRFECKSVLRSHVRTHSGEKLSACPFCGEVFCNHTKMLDHLARKAEGDSNMVCQLCRKGFPDERLLRLHCSRHVMQCVCGECGSLFACTSDLSRHERAVHSHRNTPIRECTHCGQKFATERILQQHLSLHRPNSFHCPHCSDSFRWAKQLKKHLETAHVKTSTQYQKYLCHVCEVRYESGSNLTRHLKKKHQFEIPDGFSRFQYKLCADGAYRLQTKKCLSENLKTSLDQIQMSIRRNEEGETEDASEMGMSEWERRDEMEEGMQDVELFLAHLRPNEL